ncbi:MAG TPA: GNAT family N-acetyltransferase [Acidimicrobiales bacterium]|nr:GNAT family N-acetyltransferase [Acidimicrobiales bacterium]
MNGHCELQTKRLLLRRWTIQDRIPFSEMNADPEVTRYFKSSLSKNESDLLATKLDAQFDISGFGMWAVEVPGEAAFIGFVGIAPVDFDAHFTPCVEVGWRLDRKWWGHGLAPEGAVAALNYGFFEHGLQEIVAFTAVNNEKSRRVMDKLSMDHDSIDDFDHPRIPARHPLQRHVLYRLHRPSNPID